ncbi:hypothetical protein TWF594_006867 [Orbilia oligospora]|uniref:Formin GTPase-binding domain-containing protein n=1 Tax=Orbilia oligospora TaxID=2813651 RepID=A0A7C8NSB6_ORBOL|nr:hypothetical protein TWF706_001232 [Orbilia oligospora]KAF3129449.1 hypothetical protein TWF703_008914 [Orbilia oligospora]KAF3138674.1 hypothetical protein TWF594_006867 [Orbilia oligospora]
MESPLNTATAIATDPPPPHRGGLRATLKQFKERLINIIFYNPDDSATITMASSMAPPPSPTKRASRFFGGRHKRAESVSDNLGLMGPPQLPPLDFSFSGGAANGPPSPTKTDQHGFGGPLPKPNLKARHMKTPSLMDLLTGKSKKDAKKDSDFTISTDDDCQDEQNSRNPRAYTTSRVLQPAFVEQSQSMSDQLDASFLDLRMQNESSLTLTLDQENFRPPQKPSRILGNTNKALPPIKTDIPDEIAREISLYTPRLYSASGQRNFAITPELRAPQPRPTTFYGQQAGERKSSWGSIISMGKRNSMGEADHTSNEHGGFLSRVTSFGSGGNKRVHPAALESGAPSTVTLNHEFNNLLSNYGLPHNIKNGASEMPAHVKATLLKSSKVMSRTPLPPPSSHGSPPLMTGFSPVTPAREKKKRPLSAFGAALFRGEHTRARSKTASTIGLPTRSQEDKGRPKTTRSDKAFRAAPTTPITPSAKTNVGPLHANSPCDFIDYLYGRNYNDVDLGWLRRLKRMLRNERLAWVETFFEQEGLDRLLDLIKNIYELEYHDLQSGRVIKEVFLCLKAAYTAPMADARFDAVHVELFTMILSMMFDEERKKTPYEYETREAAISLMFTYLQQAPLDQQVTRARSLVKILENPPLAKSQQGPAWVEAIKQPRPFTRWSSEVARLTYETGWVWYHPGNRITLREYDPEAPFSVAHFPTPRAFMAIDGGSVNSIEMNVSNYAALHVEIMNAIIAYLPTRAERNGFRMAVSMSGMEKIMGQVLRCAGKGHHYEQLANIHSALTDWVTAARADGWESWEHVRTGRFPAESQDKVKAMRKIEAMYGPQYELPDMGLEDTVAQKKRMSMKPEESMSVFQVTDGGVSLEWDF